MEFRQAGLSELQQILALIQQAKVFLRECGVDQWQDGYPDQAAILGDINSGTGYVLTEDGAIIGYCCISFAREPAYDNIAGAWRSTGPCAVLHRMAIDDRCKGKGLATVLFGHAEALCRDRHIQSIKVDTDGANTRMQHILAKNGFTLCGVVQFQNSDKLAFEKLLDA